MGGRARTPSLKSIKSLKNMVPGVGGSSSGGGQSGSTTATAAGAGANAAASDAEGHGKDAPLPPPPVPAVPAHISANANGNANGSATPQPGNGSVESIAIARQQHVSQEVSDTLYSFKLLEALRKGDLASLQPFLPGGALAAPSSSSSTAAGTAGTEVKELTNPLLLAVRCAEDATIQLILQHRATTAGGKTAGIDVNAQESQGGNTALHIASMTGRAEAVRLLLAVPEIDDTKRNKEGKDPLQAAATPEIATLIQVSRAELNASFLTALGGYERLRPDAEEQIYALLRKPRYRALDFNAQSPESGSTLLHEAVKRKDTKMIETAAQRGADVFCRDRKGKRAIDVTKDEKVRALLRQLSNADNGLLNQAGGQASSAPPAFKGYIGKWTNLAGRYKPRWFVLENGTLSYYHNQEDEGKQMRGSINLRYAKVRADSNDNHRFEIHVSDSGAKALSKIYLRGSHPVERARWVQLLQQTQDFYNIDRPSSRASGEYGGSTGSGAPTRSSSVTSLVQPQPVRAGTMGPSASSAAFASNTISGGGSTRPITRTPSLRAPTPPMARPASSLSDRIFAHPSVGGGMTQLAAPVAVVPSAHSADTPSLLSQVSDSPHDKDDYEFSIIEDEEGGAGEKRRGLPHQTDFVLVANSLTAQVQLGNNLAASMAKAVATSSASSAAAAGSAAAATLSAEQDAALVASTSALQHCLGSVESLLQRYQTMAAEREAYLSRRYEQEIQAKHLWEENMKALAQQHAEMEAALKEASEENARKRRVLREVRGTMLSSSPSSGNLASPLAQPQGLTTSDSATTLSRGLSAATAESSYATPPSALAARRGSDLPNSISLDSARSPSGVSDVAGSELLQQEQEDVDDEFFDAIESGTLPLKVEREIESPKTERTQDFDKRIVDQASVEPYRKLRTRLPIGKDDRPSVSLWAILKNNIGKDLTKISFPVSFNEPTSMLQRMAEDMEFSECLDVAANCSDSTKRIAYVGAFAMSNYSSTIGRIAKPFNPLLGETFEYVSLDKEYRYYSEQVSHHPPISACFAESPVWEYLGCVDAKSKFLGRTFEIRPTGVAHANLKVPREWVSGTKKTLTPVANKPDRVLEHYTWNKVTTSVSGFIVGQPTIDHFGDMEITNHVTGDRCVLTFKPRGWRGKDAFEIKGAVYDASGKQVWDIAGRWNGQLVARRCGAGSGELNPDEQVNASAPTAGANNAPAPTAEYLLLWKNSEKPPAPFSLPQFAITLNDLPKGLHPWLPPTDCRLRPDLRAFESGKFDQANGLKQGLEELQRATRRKREAGELPAHSPRWFKRSVDPDSKDTIWKPEMVPHKSFPNIHVPAYWDQREQVGQIKVEKGEQAAEWQNVLHIFGEFEV